MRHPRPRFQLSAFSFISNFSVQISALLRFDQRLETGDDLAGAVAVHQLERAGGGKTRDLALRQLEVDVKREAGAPTARLEAIGPGARVAGQRGRWGCVRDVPSVLT